MPYLVVSKELKGYQVFRFSAGVSIGRAQSNDIVFDGPEDLAISRHHALVQQEGAVFVLYDRSKNGTFINNEPIDRQVLAHGTTFQITDYSFTFIDDAAARSIKGRRVQEAQGVEKEQGLETLVIRGMAGAVGSREAAALKQELAQEGVIIESEAMVNLYRDVRAVSGINVPVLILGEPGCGKEHIAHALHNYSRARGNFIALNCSSIPEGLFESELFGCVKGAFNNAIDKPGKLELAKNGTIFLDEIGDMNLALQPKLLRFMEDMEITRLGDTKIKRIRVRVVAATNQDLHAMMKRGGFREDFYQRLACIKLEVPPLRERVEDIAPLAEFFVNKFCEEYQWKTARISPSAIKLLQRYHWPGNIRELKNVLLSVLVHVHGKTVYPSHLTAVCPDLDSSGKVSAEAFPTMLEMEKRHIMEALEKSQWNKAEAARLLQISRDTLYNKIRKFGIEEA
ncbi:MAG: sigma 54-interacting transcriptional regulator [Deltaproteobacteria bacterium]|nr:sigma 54-interacting transcriptional regulator [Deltaproteobacteria bacterium]